MAVTTALCRCWCKSGQCCPILFPEDSRNVNSIYLIQFKSKMNCPIPSPWWIWGQPYKITSPWRLYPCIGKWWEQDKWEESVVFTKELAAKWVLNHGFLQFTFHLDPETGDRGPIRGTESQAQALFPVCLLLCPPNHSFSFTPVGYRHNMTTAASHVTNLHIWGNSNLGTMLAG